MTTTATMAHSHTSETVSVKMDVAPNKELHTSADTLVEPENLLKSR